MPSYQERSQYLKALAEQAYFDALAKNKSDKEDVRIGSRRGDTGRYEVLRSDGGITTNGVKTFNAALPADGFVRGVKNANAIALDHRNNRQKAKPYVQEEVIGTSFIKTLFRLDSDLYIGADRGDPVNIYSLSDAIDPANISFRIDATDNGADDWIVTGGYFVSDSALNDFSRYKYVTITSSATTEEYAMRIQHFEDVGSGIWVIREPLKVGDEVYLSDFIDSSTPKWYVRTVTSVTVGSVIVGYKIAVSATPTGAILPFIVGNIAIRLARVTDSQLAGYGWFGDQFFGSIAHGGTVTIGLVSLVAGQIQTTPAISGALADNDTVVFFKQNASSVLPTPLIENKIYIVKNPVFTSSPSKNTFDVYDGATPVILSGFTTGCYATKFNTQLSYRYVSQTFSQLNPYYKNSFLSGLDASFQTPIDTTNLINNIGRYKYFKSADLGFGGSIYLVPDYAFLRQGQDLNNQFVIKVTTTKTDDPLNDFVDLEYRLYTKGEYIVIGTDYIGYPPDLYPDKQARVFTDVTIANGNALINLIDNIAVHAINDYTYNSDGVAEIVYYELSAGLVVTSTTSAAYFSIPTEANFLSYSAFVSV